MSCIMRFGKEKVMNRKSIMQRLKQMGGVWLFVIPALIPLIVFWIYPIFRSLFISFTDWDYMSPTYNFVFLTTLNLCSPMNGSMKHWEIQFYLAWGRSFRQLSGACCLPCCFRKISEGAEFINLFYSLRG